MNRGFFSTDRPNRFLNHLIYIPILYIYTYIVQEPRCSQNIILLCVYHYYVLSTDWFFFHCTASLRRPLKTLSAGTYRYTFFSLLTFLLFIFYFLYLPTSRHELGTRLILNRFPNNRRCFHCFQIVFVEMSCAHYCYYIQ